MRFRTRRPTSPILRGFLRRFELLTASGHDRAGTASSDRRVVRGLPTTIRMDKADLLTSGRRTVCGGVYIAPDGQTESAALVWKRARLQLSFPPIAHRSNWLRGRPTLVRSKSVENSANLDRKRRGPCVARTAHRHDPSCARADAIRITTSEMGSSFHGESSGFDREAFEAVVQADRPGAGIVEFHRVLITLMSTESRRPQPPIFHLP
jgi:hypothetical protein